MDSAPRELDSPPRERPLSPSLKRDRESIEGLMHLEKPSLAPPFFADAQGARSPGFASRQKDEAQDLGATRERQSSPAGSSMSSLTEAQSATPSCPASPNSLSKGGGASPFANVASALAAVDGSAAHPPAKKVKLTPAEEDVKRIMKQIRSMEKAEERSKREVERARVVEERARKEADREAERRKREAEREEKRRKREEEKARTEEERKRKEEDKKKKEASQLKLGNFFLKQASATKDRSVSPAPNPQGAVACLAVTTPAKAEETTYQKLFPDFFCRPDVTLAPINRFQRDQDATMLAERNIDDFTLGKKGLEILRSFDAVSLFHFSSHAVALRGKRCMVVRDIMAELNGKSTRPIDLTTDSQNSQIKRTSDLLRKIPMKFLKFQEDVRPPYHGTYTSRPTCGGRKLARRPMTRALVTTDYDYDSEAEWVEDEDAEDLNSEGEEDDEGLEDSEDLEGFLDDEGDETSNSRVRTLLQGDLEPISTGLCWEDRRGRNMNAKMMSYRMEIIHDTNPKSIDPFSTEYWKPASKTSMNPPSRLPLSAMATTSSSINGSNSASTLFPPRSSTDIFKASSSLSHKSSSQTSTTGFTSKSSFAVIIPSAKATTSDSAKPHKSSSSTTTADKILPAEDLERFRAEVAGSDLSKVGLIEVLKKKFPGRKGAMIKKTLEVVAKRVGGKEVDKRWVIVDGGLEGAP